MKKKLNENKERIAPAAYNKAINAVVQLESIFAVSDQMLRVISYLFKRMEEVTPLMLQKLLYFTQGGFVCVKWKEHVFGKLSGMGAWAGLSGSL